MKNLNSIILSAIFIISSFLFTSCEDVDQEKELDPTPKTEKLDSISNGRTEGFELKTIKIGNNARFFRGVSDGKPFNYTTLAYRINQNKVASSTAYFFTYNTANNKAQRGYATKAWRQNNSPINEMQLFLYFGNGVKLSSNFSFINTMTEFELFSSVFIAVPKYNTGAKLLEALFPLKQGYNYFKSANPHISLTGVSTEEGNSFFPSQEGKYEDAHQTGRTGMNPETRTNNTTYRNVITSREGITFISSYLNTTKDSLVVCGTINTRLQVRTETDKFKTNQLYNYQDKSKKYVGSFNIAIAVKDLQLVY
jgi:hypothetical protein